MRRRILSILLPILLPLSVLAYDFQAGHLFYNILDPIQRQVEVTYEDPYQAILYARLRTVTIPAKVKKDSVEYTVIGIGETAFHNCPKLRRVRLPKTLQYIDSAACAEMLSLDSLTLPYGLQRISDAAFYHCPSLSYIDIPSTVDSIGHNVFRYCRLLRRIFVDPDNPRYDSRGNCNGVCLTDSDRLIATCSRTTFPFDLRQVGDLAFAYSPYLRKAILPDSVREIGYAAFAGCDVLDTVYFPPKVNTLGEWAFYGCQRLKHITLPDSITCIPFSCFAECNDLREITTPITVDSLAERAFYFSGIREADLRGVRYIGVSCFSGCRFLHTITLSPAFETLAPTALENCNALKRIYIPIGQRKRIQKLLPEKYHKIIFER